VVNLKSPISISGSNSSDLFLFGVDYKVVKVLDTQWGSLVGESAYRWITNRSVKLRFQKRFKLTISAISLSMILELENVFLYSVLEYNVVNSFGIIM
jgi:hypothetical protein